MKIVVSIPVHEQPQVILDQIANIKHYIKEPLIILHISKEFYEAQNGNFSMLMGIKDVFLNPQHLSVKWGNVAHVHISNFRYISNVTNFDYFLLQASNDMYVKSGIEVYISQFEAGFCRRILQYEKTMWWPCQKAHEDAVLLEIMTLHGIKNIVATQVEGSFYRKDIFQTVTDYIGDIDLSKGEQYSKEEIYFSTIAYALCNESTIGYPTTYSEVHEYDRTLWRIQRFLYSFWQLPILRSIATNERKEELYYRIINQYERKKPYAINKKIIKKIVTNDTHYILKHAKMNDYPGKFRLYDGNVFSVKRVERNMENEMRRYIRGIS